MNLQQLAMPDSSPSLSFVIPVYNEAATLAPLFEKIEAVVKENELGPFEALFVDDGSTDGSWEQLKQLQADHPASVRALRFRRNYGKAEALTAGFSEAAAPFIVMLDADLQDDPAEIPKLLDKLNDGYDCVSGWKQARKDPAGKTIPSRIFNGITRMTSGVPLHDFNSGFKAFRAEAVRDLGIYGELHRYIPVLLAAQGFTSTEVPVRHHPRAHGVSKYGWKRLVKGGLDLMTIIVLTRYLKRPGHFFGGFGLLGGAAGFAILAFLSIQKLAFGIPIGTRPLFFLGILLLLLGVQLLSTGLIGELIQYHARADKPAKSNVAERL
ncbi:MAG: glycosyltransferase family 2 protein [Opitutales bacterium]